MNDEPYLRAAIAGDNATGGRGDKKCLVLRGDLTQQTVRALATRLDLSQVRPASIDARAVRTADTAALVQFADWMRRSGVVAMRVVHAPRALTEMIARCRLERVLPVASAEPALH